MSKRQQKRLEAAEHVCRAFRKGISYAATQQHYMNMALDWLIVWMDNAPNAVKFADPTPRKKRKQIAASGRQGKEGSMSTATTERFRFDEERQTWICPKHGDVIDFTAWVPCYAGCDEGMVDDYENEGINCNPGDVSTCPECHGKGGFRVCGQCNIDNPDAEF